MFVARPLAVWLCLLPFRFPWREQLFISWVGLRGAVPIILALFPLLAGIPEAVEILDVAFFVVIVSLTVQGWSIPALARALRLEVPPQPEPAERHELMAGQPAGPVFLGFRLSEHARPVGHEAGELRLPGEARLVAVLRDGMALAPAAAGRLAAGDVLYVLASAADGAMLGEMLSTTAAPDYLEKRRFYGDFTLRGDASLDSVAAQYGLPLPQAMAGRTLEEFLNASLPEKPVVGDRVRLGKLEFVVRSLAAGRITQVGLRIPTHLGGHELVREEEAFIMAGRRSRVPG